MNSELSLFARGSRAAPLWRDGRAVLDTEREWFVEGPPEILDRVEEELQDFSERISRSQVLLDFRNSVGRYTLPGMGEIELVSGKWGGSDFDNMLCELSDIAAGLPFSRMGGGVPYELVSLPERRVPYHAYVYLRYALCATTAAEDRLDLAFQRVLERPHRRLTPSTRLVKLEHARDLGTQGMLQAVASPWNWSKQATGRARIAAATRGYLPECIEEEQRSSSLDTAENRFAGSVLSLACTIIDRTRRYAHTCGRSTLRNRLLQDCEQMARVLEPIRAHALWRDVGPMLQFPASSLVLQRRYGYREILRAFVRLRLISRIPHKNTSVNDLLALKNIAALYELWCFFCVVRAVKRRLGAPSEPISPQLEEAEMSVPHSMEVKWRDGTRVVYNAQFSQRSRHRSTSLPLRPDVVLQVASGRNRGLHLLDAKFRLRPLQSGPAQNKDAAHTFRPDDLHKMHAYRDAIPEARSVWIMYPGTQHEYFPSGDGAADQFDGVGVIPTRPGECELDRVVGQLIGH